ncbi:MAG: hypothetical protein KF851_01880 [Pirellulaceae bacterium]|jgi:hypothetical protein|nr:hypothetical protein [Pirellulaceae bacterium]
MSLFEDTTFQYRDTFFVLFDKDNRPTADRLRKAFAKLGSRYEVLNVCETPEGIESLTIKSPYDFSAMDIVYVEGEEVTGQIKDLMEEFRAITLIGDEAQKIQQLKSCDARFDIFHFEQSVPGGGMGEDDDQLDPGGLLLVIDKLSELSNGTGLDPQSMSIL